MRNIIKELLNRKSAGTLGADDPLFTGDFTPLKPLDVENAEKRLGFQLTPLLSRVFTEVANGGFGPSYGLLGLVGGMKNEDGNDAVAQYHLYLNEDPDDPYWQWPNGLLPLGHLGCAMYVCVDCTKASGPVTVFEPNGHDYGQPWDNAFFPLAASTEEWLFAWLDGEDIFEKLASEG